MEVTVILTTVSTSLSICGCIMIFLAHKFWTDVRSNSRNILLYITIADLFTAGGYLFDIQSHWKDSCVIQSFITTTSSMMSFFWTSCMALYLYVVSVKANYKLGKRIIFVFHCVSWPVPLLICIAAMLAGKLGDDCTKTTNWCWIKEECRIHNETNGTKMSDTPRYQTVFWMLLAGKFWEITSYILIIIIYARVYKHVHEQRKMVEGQSNATAVARFRAAETRTILIPKFFIFIRMWGTLQFLYFAISGNHKLPVIEYFQAIGDGAQGFVNAILFCCLTDRMKSYVCKCFGRNEVERESLLHAKQRPIQVEAKHSNPV